MLFYISILLWCNSVIGSDNLCKICSCGEVEYFKQQMYAVNCTYAGITESNVSVLENLPERTQVLIFNGNNVRKLPVNIFGEDKINENLKIIDMTDNKIEQIKGKTFHRIPFVERLILDHNSISLAEIHPRIFSNLENLRELHLTDAFLDYKSADLAEQLHTIFQNSNLNQLEKLHLEQNEIQSFVDKMVFCNLKNLTDIYLGNNKLKGLSFNITCLPRLRYIDFEANEIERFSNEDLAIFDSFPSNSQSFRIDIHKNPFICDCVASNLYFWLRRTKVAVKHNDTLRCHYLKSVNDSILLKDLHASECTNPYNSMAPMAPDSIKQFMHYFLLSTFSIFAVVLIYLSIKYSFVYCRHTVVPTGKVHYVVIRNPEDNREVHV